MKLKTGHEAALSERMSQDLSTNEGDHGKHEQASLRKDKTKCKLSPDLVTMEEGASGLSGQSGRVSFIEFHKLIRFYLQPFNHREKRE